MNSARPASNTRRAPIRSPSDPEGRSSPADTTVYASSTHCSELTPPPTSRPIDGKTTLTIVASRIADIANVGALVADPARARVLLALGDGRALPASVLADEAGVAASTASVHLAKLVDGGLLTVKRHAVLVSDESRRSLRETFGVQLQPAAA